MKKICLVMEAGDLSAESVFEHLRVFRVQKINFCYQHIPLLSTYQPLLSLVMSNKCNARGCQMMVTVAMI